MQKKVFKLSYVAIKEALKGLFHLLSWVARRLAPGGRYARGRAGRAFVYGVCGAKRRLRFW